MSRFDNLNSQVYTTAPSMPHLEIDEQDNEAHDGKFFRFHSSSPEGDVLEAEAEFLTHAGRVLVKFHTAENIAAGLEVVVETIMNEARTGYWKANPHATLRIDIDAGRFTNELTQIAPRFGFTGPEPAGEFGTEDQYVRFRAELPLAG